MSDHLLMTSCGWYFRMAVPADLRLKLGKREIKKPLYVPDKKSAIKKARVLACEVDALFESLRGETMSRKLYSLLPGFSGMVLRSGFSPDGLFTSSLDISSEELKQVTLEELKKLYDAASAASAAPAVISTAQKPSLTISELIQKYCYEKNEVQKSWTSKSAGEIRTSLDLLVTVLGDIPITEVDADKASEVFRKISALPSNWKKRPEYRDKTIDQLGNVPESDRLSAKTVNKTMDRIKSLWEWAVEKDYVEKQRFNKLKQKDDSLPDEDRAQFNQDQLSQIFQSEIFTAKKFEDPFHYWTPLIALFSGMRQTEIGQLYLTDIHRQDGVWAFDVNKKANDKKIKTKFSARKVPIHSYLLNAGILQYRDSLLEQGHSRLFPELNFSTANGYGDDISDWFAKYRISVGIPADGPTFHSFRHTVSTELMNSGVQEAIAAKILGHAHKPITFGRYAKKPIEVLQEAVEELEFGEALENVAPWGQSPVIQKSPPSSVSIINTPSSNLTAKSSKPQRIETPSSDLTTRIFKKSLEAVDRN